MGGKEENDAAKTKSNTNFHPLETDSERQAPHNLIPRHYSPLPFNIRNGNEQQRPHQRLSSSSHHPSNSIASSPPAAPPTPQVHHQPAPPCHRLSDVLDIPLAHHLFFDCPHVARTFSSIEALNSNLVASSGRSSSKSRSIAPLGEYATFNSNHSLTVPPTGHISSPSSSSSSL